MGYKAKNNANSSLATAISASATTISLTPGSGDRFPVIAGADFTMLTLEDGSGEREIVRLTSRALGADTMTIEREQEGTTARLWPSGTNVALRLTAQVMQEAIEHKDLAANAHPATAIGVADSPHGGFLAGTLQAILNILDNLKAPKASPTFTGTDANPPRTRTLPQTSNDTGIASTAFVKTAVSNALGALDNTAQVNGQQVGYRNLPRQDYASNQTLVLADAGKHIVLSGAITTLTIPLNAAVAFPVGTTITLAQFAGQNITIACAGTLAWMGTDLNGNRTLAPRGLATLLYFGGDTWAITGIRLT